MVVGPALPAGALVAAQAQEVAMVARPEAAMGSLMVEPLAGSVVTEECWAPNASGGRGAAAATSATRSGSWAAATWVLAAWLVLAARVALVVWTASDVEVS